MKGSLRNDVLTIRQAGWEERDGLLYSPALSAMGLVAGFSTRRFGSMGGRATPPEESSAHRTALAARLGFEDVVRVKQVHGDRVVRADGPFDPWPEADGMWTDRTGVLLGIVAADCVPILAADDSGLIGAAHAGWEGTTRQIARQLVAELRAAGADPLRIVASLGPSIGPCCYTIDAERAATIRDRLAGAGPDGVIERDGVLAFDLWTANAIQLARAGVPYIEAASTCTRCGGLDVWSYRGRGETEVSTGLALGFIGRSA